LRDKIKERVNSLAFRGQRMLIAGLGDGKVLFWDLEKGDIVKEL
jgi:hypothetical protein